MRKNNVPYEMQITIRGLTFEDAQYGYRSLTNPAGEREPLHGSEGMLWSGGFYNNLHAQILFGRAFDKVDGSVTIRPSEPDSVIVFSHNVLGIPGGSRPGWVEWLVKKFKRRG